MERGFRFPKDRLFLCRRGCKKALPDPGLLVDDMALLVYTVARVGCDTSWRVNTKHPQPDGHRLPADPRWLFQLCRASKRVNLYIPGTHIVWRGDHRPRENLQLLGKKMPDYQMLLVGAAHVGYQKVQKKAHAWKILGPDILVTKSQPTIKRREKRE